MYMFASVYLLRNMYMVLYMYIKLVLGTILGFVVYVTEQLRVVIKIVQEWNSSSTIILA